MVEPVVGNPQKMAEAIAAALDLIVKWREYNETIRGGHAVEVHEYAKEANWTIGEIWDTLKNYTED